MVKGDLWHEIHSRFKLKERKKSIARALQIDIQTVRRILRQVSPQPYMRKSTEGGLLAPFREYALQRMAAVRLETPPGRQGQADWGQCWTTIAGKRMRVHLFVLTLGFSRRMYAVATSDEKMPAFLRSHEEAFEFLGGVPHEIV
jgi:transposase